jgi:hypothetical protein
MIPLRWVRGGREETDDCGRFLAIRAIGLTCVDSRAKATLEGWLKIYYEAVRRSMMGKREAEKKPRRAADFYGTIDPNSILFFCR